MEKYKQNNKASCEKCVIQSRIIQKYSEEIVDLQRQVSVLSSRLLKYEPDPPVETLCVIKLEDNTDEEFLSIHDVVDKADEDENDCKDVAVDSYSESSRGDFDPDYGEQNPDENSDSSESNVKKAISSKSISKNMRNMRKCKTCNEEFSSSRGLYKHHHEVHGKIGYQNQRYRYAHFIFHSL